MEKIVSKARLRSIVEKQTEKAIDKLFKKLHKKAKTKSGDTDPMQMEELDEISERLVRLIVAQVWQNME